MPLNFFNIFDYSDSQVDAITEAVKAWCGLNGVDAESECARAATAVAIDLLSRDPSASCEGLLKALSLKMSANKDGEPSC
ncbi:MULTISPECIES: hypothetical protein [Rhizobium]|uniref:Uncharacterized protein n=1 Tax=Rhizobium favelukesii TaxID=348824 RepID=W6RIU9_9HYPH|nr:MULTISPECIES: hypothetical protein [Rhizobium]MCA0806791.1 hypothetical protein [Rhizobium sp. T1473]MCS0462053.1 hypothetical protein [Rhizobium favelukesii]UFS85714.1 hypothetical protein LPB79_36090 [Rhizobium sp. T136]CDM61077.1 hypothetical protein LPU83_pLPU83c_0515 [Rhizobium favelukesii]